MDKPTTRQRRRKFHITIASGGKTIITVSADADTPRNALKEAHKTLSSWEGKDPAEWEETE